MLDCVRVRIGSIESAELRVYGRREKYELEIGGCSE